MKNIFEKAHIIAIKRTYFPKKFRKLIPKRLRKYITK